MVKWKRFGSLAVAIFVFLWHTVPIKAITLPDASFTEFYRDTENRTVLERLTAIGVVNENGEAIRVDETDFSASISGAELVLDGVNPNQTFYIYFGHSADASNATQLYYDQEGNGSQKLSGRVAGTYDLFDDRLFSFSVDEVTGGNMVFDVYPLPAKTLGRFVQGSWLKVSLRDDLTDQEYKVVLDFRFQAKKDAVDPQTGSRYSNTLSANYLSGDYTNFRLTLWIKNTALDGNFQEMDIGDTAILTPISGGENTLIWGDNKARLQFFGSYESEGVYVGLRTATDREFYETYAVPAEADIWFYDFLGRDEIPGINAAKLTLGYPWPETYAYRPEPGNCFLYARTSTGKYIDVTDQFTLDTTGDFPGWHTTVDYLGSYCISDTDLSAYGLASVPTQADNANNSYNVQSFFQQMDKLFSREDSILPDIKLPANTGLRYFTNPRLSDDTSPNIQKISCTVVCKKFFCSCGTKTQAFALTFMFCVV